MKLSTTSKLSSSRRARPLQLTFLRRAPQPHLDRRGVGAEQSIALPLNGLYPLGNVGNAVLFSLSAVAFFALALYLGNPRFLNGVWFFRNGLRCGNTTISLHDHCR